MYVYYLLLLTIACIASEHFLELFGNFGILYFSENECEVTAADVEREPYSQTMPAIRNLEKNAQTVHIRWAILIGLISSDMHA